MFRNKLIKAHPGLGWKGALDLASGDPSLIKMYKCASVLYIHTALLQVNMGIWTPHYIKQNNLYHSSYINKQQINKLNYIYIYIYIHVHTHRKSCVHKQIVQNPAVVQNTKAIAV